MSHPPEDDLSAWKTKLRQKSSQWEEQVYNSQQYQQELNYVRDITHDFINGLRSVSIYSTRAVSIYDQFLTIRAIDDLIQSSIGVLTLAENGIHNSVRRELRYVLEMTTKYAYIDHTKMGSTIQAKTQFLRDQVPNSSIEIANSYSTPFTGQQRDLFINDIKDAFYKACAYVHPSKKQLDEQLRNYNRGNTIGFDSAKMFTSLNATIFRCYDLILTMTFHSFGSSMSKDIFEYVLHADKKWKFHKGKYTLQYNSLLFPQSPA